MKAKDYRKAFWMMKGREAIGAIWRTPYVIYIDGEEQQFVKFNYQWHLIENGNQIRVTDQQAAEFKDRPRQFNSVAIEDVPPEAKIRG